MLHTIIQIGSTNGTLRDCVPRTLAVTSHAPTAERHFTAACERIERRGWERDESASSVVFAYYRERTNPEHVCVLYRSVLSATVNVDTGLSR